MWFVSYHKQQRRPNSLCVRVLMSVVVHGRRTRAISKPLKPTALPRRVPLCPCLETIRFMRDSPPA